MLVVWTVIIGSLGTFFAWLIISGFWGLLVIMAIAGGAYEAYKGSDDANSNRT